MDNIYEVLMLPMLPKIKELIKEAIREERETAKEPFADLPEYLTNKETCQILNISQTTLNRYVKEGKPKRYKMGKNGCTPRFKKSEVLQTLKTLNKYERR
jgi:excisionase family DNA binding protein